jgi:hypothetical protein
MKSFIFLGLIIALDRVTKTRVCKGKKSCVWFVCLGVYKQKTKSDPSLVNASFSPSILTRKKCG